MKFTLFFKLNNVWQYMTGDKEAKENVQKIWERDNYISGFRRCLYTEDSIGIKSYLNFLTPEKWDNGFFGTNFLYDVVYRQTPEIVELILNTLNSKQKKEIYTSSSINHFLEHITFIPGHGGSTDETTSFRPMQPKTTSLVLNSIMEHNAELLDIKDLIRTMNKIQTVIVKKAYPSSGIANFQTNESVNLQILLEVKTELEHRKILKEENKNKSPEKENVLPLEYVQNFSFHQKLSIEEKEQVQSILDMVATLPQKKLDTEAQHSLYTIMKEHLPELINNFAPIPHNISNYSSVKESFKASLNEIAEQVSDIYTQAYQSNIDNINIKEQFLNSKKMKASI